MIEEDIETTVKCIVVGNGQCGKTSMITRFAHSTFSGQYKKTLAVDFIQRRCVVPACNNEEIVYHLWDTAGQEEYDALTRGYYKGAGAVVLVFSTTDLASFNAVRAWLGKVREELGSEVPTVLVQNKVDLLDEAKMSPDEVEDLARSLGLKLFRTSVKEDLNVQEVFVELGRMFLSRDAEQIPPKPTGVFGLDDGSGGAAGPTTKRAERKKQKFSCAVL